MVLIWVACSFISILVHELGHGFALKVFGQRSVIVLHGFGGVTISQRRTTLARARSIIVSVAGSLTGLIVLWLPTRAYLESSASFEDLLQMPEFVLWGLFFLEFQNLWWSIANLLPVRPLDGGNVITEIVGVDRARKLSIGFAIAAAIWCFFNDQNYGGFFFLILAFMNFQEIRAVAGGGGHGRVPRRRARRAGRPGPATPEPGEPLGGRPGAAAAMDAAGPRSRRSTWRGRPSSRATWPRPSASTAGWARGPTRS